MNEERQAAKALETIAAAHGVAMDKAFGAVTPPLYLSSTYAFNGYEQPNRYDYGRAGNPSRDLLSEARSEEHTSELQSLMRISYAVFCLKKKNTKKNNRQ